MRFVIYVLAMVLLPSHVLGKITFKLSARDLADKDGDNDKSDPFAKVLQGSSVIIETEKKDNNHEPEWSEKISIYSNTRVDVNIRDYDASSADDDMGWARFYPKDIYYLRPGEKKDYRITEEGTGTLTVTRICES